MTLLRVVAAHLQRITHAYTMHYPAHPPRDQDPHKADFDEYKRRRRANGTFYCDFAHMYRADSSECVLTSPLECHHSIIEYALQNGVDLARLEKFYPGVSRMGVGKWIDSAANLMILCSWHHRGHGGVHVASASDWEAYKFIQALIS